MIKTVVVVLGLLFFIYLVSLLFPQISKRDRVIGLIVAATLIILAAVYEHKRESDRNRDFMIREAFENGERLYCRGDNPVSKDEFNYISGTNTFTGKPGSSVSLQRYSVGECRLMTEK